MTTSMLIALIGGTLISIALGYLIAYGKDFFEKSSSSDDFESWSKGFDHLVGGKKAEFRDSSAKERDGFSSGSSRQQYKSAHEASFEKLSSLYEEMGKTEEGLFFEKCRVEGREFIQEQCKKRATEFKRKWGHSLSDHYLKERLIELSQEQAFIQNKSLKQALNLKDCFELWESYSGASLLLDDARLGSSTISKDLEKKLSLDPFSVYRGIEYWFLSKAGQSKASLVHEYWNSLGKGGFERSQKIAKWSEARRRQIILSLCFPARHKVKTFPEILKDLEQSILELEASLGERQKKENTGQGAKKEHSQQKKSQSKKQTSKPKSSPKKPLTDFEVLGISQTSDWHMIKKAYRKMAMKYHPDRVETQTEQEARQVHERYVEIQKAYENLEKRVKRRAA